MEQIKRKSGTKYREKIYVNGKALTKTFARKTDARDWRNRVASDRDRAVALGVAPAKEISFEDFVQLWNERKAGSISITTRKRYLGLQRLYLLPALKNKMLRELSKDQVAEFCCELRNRNVPDQTIDQVIRTLKTMCFDAMKWEYLKTNPVSCFPKQSRSIKREVYWDEDEVKAFLDATRDDPLYYLYLVALRLGLRRAELAGLKWDAINFGSNNISIRRIRDRYGERETTKTLEKREIFMNRDIREVFRSLHTSRKSEYVFSRADGRPVDIQHVYRAFNAAQKRAGMALRITLHDCRHTFASIFLMRGGNINALAKIMGHSKIAMTERYGHITANHAASEMEKMCFGDLTRVSSPHIAHEKQGNQVSALELVR